MTDATPMSPSSNVAQLRDDIDSGRAGDKAGGFDPAAAPLGTDEEAGGASLSPQDIALARHQETGMNTATANAAEPAVTPDAAMPRNKPVWSGVAVGAAAAVIAAVAAAVFILPH